MKKKKKKSKRERKKKYIIEALFPSFFFFNKQLLNLKVTLQYKETYKEHLNLLHKTERVQTTLNMKYKANPGDRLLHTQYCSRPSSPR